MKRTEIIAVGSELLLGEISNTNARYLSEQLSKYGLSVLYHVVVGDNFDRLRETFEQANRRSELVIVTGGLGPTNDDITKQVLADLLGRPLVRDEASLDTIQRFVASRGRAINDGDARQADVLSGAEVLHNPAGLAPGMWVEDETTWLLLPGVPREMTAIVEATFPSKFSGATIVSESLRFYEIGESALDEAVSDLMDGVNPTVAPYAESGEARLRVSAKAETEDAARQMIDRVKRDILSRVGAYYFGSDEDTLAAHLIRELRRRHATLSIAESLTGGQVQAMLTAVPGASEVFLGGVVTYSDKLKNRFLGVSLATIESQSVVSKQVALEMIQGLVDQTDSDYGLSFTGEAGPVSNSGRPVGTVFIGVKTPSGMEVIERVYPHQQRNVIQARAAKDGLWALWQRMKKGE
ncbi:MULTISPECIES: competence/damage-inducible protein A [unclassified Exiguobacterium]|uniref:competence/damage-inducible protein A n=1 Tax=unclassified Exiguobacterium TaxID=2644629 RepID=UPI001039CA62|nr:MULTISPECIES: competence/damage-inducible protein A [unclassified Exiguobacterium]TCI25166.1 competence/damage-inducible protein A [Exiguobacterium sp. SH5S4]TCI57109.1 competence/damage-inducible protein A [Exiguobacterium sp. SH5S13]TCI62715.1 competence/damage-inducible protein A [Exiguobacterium sp. SH3S1]